MTKVSASRPPLAFFLAHLSRRGLFPFTFSDTSGSSSSDDEELGSSSSPSRAGFSPLQSVFRPIFKDGFVATAFQSTYGPKTKGLDGPADGPADGSSGAGTPIVNASIAALVVALVVAIRSLREVL